MKRLLLVIATLIFTASAGMAQKNIDKLRNLEEPGERGKNMDRFTASNGITYRVGDEVKLGRGSAPNGDYLYLQRGGWGALAFYEIDGNSDQNNIGRGYSGLYITIKKIRTVKLKGHEKVYFVVGGGNITNYNLLIEDAIATCEIADCKSEAAAKPAIDNIDKLERLKKLLDSGALTEPEYQAEKKKILNQ